MNIRIMGYFDRNFGDDMMIKIIVNQLSEDKFFLYHPKREMLIPFENCNNIIIMDSDNGLDYDAVLNVTGSGFTIYNKIGILYAAIETAKQLFDFKKKPYLAVIGCNIGPFKNWLAEQFVLHDLKRYNLLTVRDSASFHYGRDHIQKSTCVQYPDIVFGIPEEWCFEKTGESCLGISAYNRKDCNRNYEFYLKMAQIADHYSTTKNKKVLLFALNTGYENDLSAAIIIRDLCRNKESVEIIPYEQDGGTILKHFARCSVFVGVRFHSIVLSLKMQIPLIPVIYSKKTEMMLCDLQYDGYQTGIDQINLSEITELLDQGIPVFQLPRRVTQEAKKHSLTFKEEYKKNESVRNHSSL